MVLIVSLVRVRNIVCKTINVCIITFPTEIHIIEIIRLSSNIFIDSTRRLWLDSTRRDRRQATARAGVDDAVRGGTRRR
jgi:hypothetical protein